MPGTGRFDYLDGIRAVAIGAVLLLHWFSWYTPLFHGGSVGVDVFFVLSGFIITTMLWRTHIAGPSVAAWAAFVRRRVVRLYPALVGLVVGGIVLYAVVPWAPDDPVEVARRGVVVLTQTSAVWAAEQHGSLWLPGLQPFGQTWSLAVEWYFYLLWPVAVLARPGSRLERTPAGRRVPGRRGRGVRRCRCRSARSGSTSGRSSARPSCSSAPLSRCGSPRAVARPGPLGTRPPPPCSRSPRLAAYVVLGPDGHALLYRFVGVPVAVGATVLLIHTGYGHPRRRRHRLLGHPWPAAVGRYSYSLYLWHIVPFLLLQDAPVACPSRSSGWSPSPRPSRSPCSATASSSGRSSVPAATSLSPSSARRALPVR